MELAEPTWTKAIRVTFAQILGRIAVPTFFIISGYLFFAKRKPFFQTLQSKFRSLFLPYVLWTVFTIILYYFVQLFEFSSPYFSNPESLIANWGVREYLSAFWEIESKGEHSGMPLVFQFWYVRNLMVMFVISPIIKLFAQRCPLAYFVFISFLMLMSNIGLFEDYNGWVTALFYFSLGYYAVNHIDTIIKIVDSIKMSDFLIAYAIPFMLSICAYFRVIKGGALILWLNWLFAILLAVKLAGWAATKEKLYDKLSYLAGFSFWIYAAHAPFLIKVLNKLGAKLLPMTGGWFLVHFFGVFFISVGVLLALGILLKRFLPRFYALFCGGR